MKKLSLCILLVFYTGSLMAQCFDSTIQSPSPFMGNNGEIFKLSNNSIWEVKYEYSYMYAYYPTVTICPSQGFMIVKDKKLKVISLNSNKKVSGKSTIESSIDGNFNGFDGDTIFKLVNGQIWQQSEYYYHYHYAYSPKVTIYNVNGQYKLKVDGISKSIGVKQIN